MSTEYRFSLTPRLIALALFGGVALMVLLFALGYQVGRQMSAPPAAPLADGAAAGARLLDRAAKDAAAATAPLKQAQP